MVLEDSMRSDYSQLQLQLQRAGAWRCAAAPRAAGAYIDARHGHTCHARKLATE